MSTTLSFADTMAAAAYMRPAKIGNWELIDNWLRHIKDVYSRYRDELSSIVDKTVRADRLCELNVIEQVKNACHTTIVQNAWAEGKALAVHGLIYGLSDGLLRDLGVQITHANQLDAIYRMHVGQTGR